MDAKKPTSVVSVKENGFSMQDLKANNLVKSSFTYLPQQKLPSDGILRSKRMQHHSTSGIPILLKNVNNEIK